MNNYQCRNINCGFSPNITNILQRKPTAAAKVCGSEEYSDICGEVKFYQLQNDVLVYAKISGLAKQQNPCGKRFYAFHIHEGTSCESEPNQPFEHAMSHYNPYGCEHPHHAGDLPPLLSSNGNALSVFITDSFSVREIIGKTVIIHSNADDFTTQPSGNSGEKIACGVVRTC